MYKFLTSNHFGIEIAQINNIIFMEQLSNLIHCIQCIQYNTVYVCVKVLCQSRILDISLHFYFYSFLALSKQ